MELLKRKDWGAKQPKSSFSKLSDIKGLVVHWSAYPTALSKTEELTQIKQIQDLHQNDRGWNDIAYNFCVGDSGTIYEARGFENRSAAQGGNTRDEINYNNRHYVAVCWLGGSNPDDQPSKEAVDFTNFFINGGSHNNSKYGQFSKRKSNASKQNSIEEKSKSSKKVEKEF